MTLYTARVRLAQGLPDPRGRGDAMMTHHAELPSDAAADEWGARIALEAQNGGLGQRWAVDRSGSEVHVVETFRRSLEDRSFYTHVSDVRFSLDEPVGDLSVPIPFPTPGGGTETIDLGVKSKHMEVDPAAAVTVVERAWSGTSPLQRRCYVGPIAPVYLVAQLSVPIGPLTEVGYSILPGLPGDVPSDLFDSDGRWSSTLADAAVAYLVAVNDWAENLGGSSQVVSWKNGQASFVQQWQASTVKARIRSRQASTWVRPPVTRSL